MAKITDIQVQKKNPERVSVFIDGEFAFGISQSLKYDKKLEIGKNLSENQIEELIEKDQVERLTEKALKFLSYRPRSEREVRDHLKRKVTNDKTQVTGDLERMQMEKSIDSVIIKLKEWDQINDSNFIKWWIEQRIKFRPMSLRSIKRELLLRGVNREIIDELIADGTTATYEDTDENTETTEEDLATRVAEKKLKNYKKLSYDETKIKLGQALARRGFDWSIIKNVVDKILKKE
ncbi:MAG: hypothetical protein A2Y57_04445 [Candidatus Woykebacteria bacterium RBG_13_40_7b]|uniref:Regulatory protein RecX n=1 Tax=Candidatus Woykebacteria bacterium RBG_13_40_7b TaxID=1802594 RepID=A0A1G1W7W0_9BACT|nr:MAG: hypothetical protein A2Y57_04445 [Candidatus Woykebacteria bacterium RBG_13_40_7b]